MRKKGWLIILVICALILTQASFAARGKYGVLKVITDDENAEIYIDGGLAGHHIVTDSKILAGTHYLQVKIDGEKIYDKGFIVHEGKQTTIFARPEGEIKRASEKASGLEGKSKYPLFYSVTYGNYNMSYSISGQSASATSQENILGLGLGVRMLNEDNANIYYVAGFNYNNKTNVNQISYIHLDVGSANETAFTELGVNYPLWKNDNISINGNIGYQIAVGFNLTDSIKWGIEYAVFNGSGSYQGDSFNISFAQPMVFVRAQ